jgi:hypothetical protein
MSDKPFAEMTLDELREERARWDYKIAAATSWGAALTAANVFRRACDREIARREANGK